jgi:hypothetical protein
MKSIIICNTVITSKAQAMNLVRWLNSQFDNTVESAIAIDELTERLVNAGFITWQDASEAW